MCPDHIHMLVRIPPQYDVSQIMGYLNGKSALMIFEKHANLKYKYGNRHFGCQGYYVDTVGKTLKSITGGFGIWSNVVERVYRPVYGWAGTARQTNRGSLEPACECSAEGGLFRASLEASR